MMRVHENSRSVDLIRIERADLDQLLDFRHRDAPCGSHVGIEIARRLAINRLPSASPFQALMSDTRPSNRSRARRSPRQRRAAPCALPPSCRRRSGCRTHRCLRRRRGCVRRGCPGIEFDLQLPCEILPLEFLVLADVRGDHLADLAGLEEQPQSSSSMPALFEITVRSLTPDARQRADQVLGTRTAQAARHHRDPVLDHAAQCARRIRKISWNSSPAPTLPAEAAAAFSRTASIRFPRTGRLFQMRHRLANQERFF